jgi:hypothetical protein
VADVLRVNPELRGDQVTKCLDRVPEDELPAFQKNLRRAGLP